MTRFAQAVRRAFISAGLVIASFGPAPAEAPGLHVEPLQMLSDCLGRVSALRVHLAAFGDTDGEARAEAMRGVLAELVSAMTPPDGSARVRTWRAEAQAAQAMLLSHAALNADAAAAAQADRLIRQCAGMIVVPDASDPA